MNAQQEIVAVKSTMAGVAAWYVAKQLGVGPSAWRFGLGIAAFNIGNYILTNRVNQDSWVTPKQPLTVTCNTLKNRLTGMVKHNLFSGVLILLGGGLSRQTQLGWAVRQGPLSAASALGRACIFGPIAHEILFRGFVQEKIEDIQHHLRTPGTPVDQPAERRTRVLAQAIIAVLVQANASRGRRDGLALGFGGLIAFALGQVKEGYGIHGSMIMHSAASTLGTIRILILGG